MDENLEKTTPSTNDEIVDKILQESGLTPDDLAILFEEEKKSPEGEEDVVPTTKITETTPELEEIENAQLETKKTQRKYAGIFNTVEDLERAYKEIQAQYTKERQKVKPYESFIELLEQNPEYAKFIIEKTQEFFFKKEKPKSEDIEEEFEEEFDFEERKKNKFAFDKNEILNLIRQEVNQALTASRMVDEFRRKYPEVTDTELVQIINHARQYGGDLETSYMVLFKDRFIENLKRQALEELKGHLASKRGAKPMTITATPTPETGKELSDDQIWDLAVKVSQNPQLLDKIEPNLRAKLLNVIARQLLL